VTLQAMKFVSEMRTNLSLMRKSRGCTSAQVVMAENEVHSYLAKRVLIYPPSMVLAGLRPNMSYIERKQALDVPDGCRPLEPEEQKFEKFLQKAAAKARRSAWIWRIGTECEDMRDKGWYPFFVTLTVDPSRVPDSEAMWKDGREFDKYLDRLARVSAKACGQASALKEGVSRHQFVRHVGVIEHGKSRHHHHMHLLVWLRGIPERWKVCPNRGISDPRRRTIDFCREMGTFWPHALPGLGKAKFFRHEGDVWSRLGFCVPVDSKKGKPFNVLPARLAGVYVSKYMDKEDKAWLHRVKATRDLGKGRLRNLLHSLPLKVVEALMWRPRTYPMSCLLTTIHCVPSGLLRSMAKQVVFCRKWASEATDFRKEMQSCTGVYTAMRQSVRDGARPSRMSLKEFYDWVTGHLPVPSGYCEKRLGSSHLQLRVEFPVCRETPVSHLGGMLR
jgi:hypothetical protein